jgi:hypothetical protein
MSKRALVLVEGQTEERFVKDVLGPAFWPRGLYLSPTILVTKRVKDGPNFKGGVTRFARFENDVLKLMRARGAVVTTILDYYGLPLDFPGMNTRPTGTSRQRVEHVEQAISAYFGSPANFVPFLALHEYEAWLFASPSALSGVMNDPTKQADIEAIRQSVSTPEEINDDPEWAPSKRILKLFPSYQKVAHGPMAAGRIGLERIRAECPHFDRWLSVLEGIAARESPTP